MKGKNISIEMFECGCNEKVLIDITGLTSICLRVAKIGNFGIVEIVKANGGFGMDYVLMGSGSCIYLFTFPAEKKMNLEMIGVDFNEKIIEEIITTLVKIFMPRLYKETTSIHGETAIKMPISALFELKDGKYIVKKELPEEKPAKTDKKESKKAEKPEEKPEKPEK